MAPKYPKNRVVAKLVTENRQPCVFCQQNVDDEVIYGKLYSIGDIQCHYFCVLLSCCLVQKGRDTEGLFGFLYKDILAEVERSKKHKCSYCGRGGASLGCSVSSCRKQFHLPCGRQKNAVSLFYGNYKSFCEQHAPKQKISDSVMVNARARMKREKLIKAGKIPASNIEEIKQTEGESAMVCVICYEEVQGYPTTQTFWPPCCGRDAWLHRSCLQRMALSAGMHYLKCPLCNDKDNFYEAVGDQGYYLPDRDAAWELEQNAFAEMYSRDAACAAPDCKCPFGRTHDELGIWDIKLCLLCGSWGMHAHCLGGERAVCAACRPAASDIEQLESRLTAVMLAEQAREQSGARSGPVMPSRMSLRRTKGRVQPHSSTSSSQSLPTPDDTEIKTESQPPKEPEIPIKSRPKLLTPNLKDLEFKLLSPIKMLEQSYMEKGGGGDVVVTDEVIQKIRIKFSKPKPLSAKKRIVNEILDDLFKNVFKDTLKSKEPLKEWNSPKKSLELATEVCEKQEKISELIMITDDIETMPPMNVNRNPENIIENDATPKPSEGDDVNCEKEKEDININNIEAKHTLDNENDQNGLNDNATNLNAPVDSDTMPEVEDIPNYDESTNSTFELPSEFVAECDESMPIFDTPKKIKDVDLTQDSSIEMSDQMTKLDVIEISSEDNVVMLKPVDNTILTFKFKSDKEDDINTILEEKSLNGVNSKCHIEFNDESKLNTIDKTKMVNRKRKREMKDVVSKKRKKSKLKIKIKTSEEKARDRRRARKFEKIKKLQKKSVRDKHLMVKIRLKDASKSKVKSKKMQKVKSFKQYVLKYSPVQTDKVIGKPEGDISPIKKKYTKITKAEKPADNLVQTSIQSFFKAK